MVALSALVYMVFLCFVFPPILGPLLQGAALLAQLAGAQMVLQRDPGQSSSYAIAGAVMTPAALIVASKIAKVSLIGLKGYGLTAMLMVPIAVSVSLLLSRITRGRLRITAGVVLMAVGIVLPAVIAGVVARDLL